MLFHIARSSGEYETAFDTTDVVRAGQLWNYIKHFQAHPAHNGVSDRVEPYIMIEKPFHWDGKTEAIEGDPEKLFTTVGQKISIGLLASPHSTNIEQWLLTITAHQDDALERGLIKLGQNLEQQGWSSLTVGF